MNRFAVGALGGLLATVPMTLVMGGLFRRLPEAQQYSLPPRQITEQVLQSAGQRVSFNNRQLRDLSLLAHFAYGAATGFLHPLLGRTRHPALCGSGYGIAVWAASYLGWIPAAGILSPATQHPTQRRRLMLCAHLVWGAGTVTIGQYLSRPRR